MTASGPGPKAPGRVDFGALLGVLGFYVAALVALVAVALAFDIRLSAGEGFLVFPSPWSLFLAFATYLAPPLVAFGFGWRPRPFKSGSRSATSCMIATVTAWSTGSRSTAGSGPGTCRRATTGSPRS